MKPFIQSEQLLNLDAFPEVCGYLCRFDTTAYEDGLYEAFQVARPKFLHRAVASRKAEFLAGRVCAGKALLRMGVAGAQLPIGDLGAPTWPRTFVGSISHTNNIALAIAGKSEELEFIGVDVANLISQEEAGAVSSVVLGEKEGSELTRQLDSRLKALTMGLSIKESFFKAAAPYVKRYFDFSDVEVLAADVSARSFKLQVRNPLCREFQPGRTIDGHYWWLSDSTLASAIIGRRAEDKRMKDPQDMKEAPHPLAHRLAMP